MMYDDIYWKTHLKGLHGHLSGRGLPHPDGGVPGAALAGHLRLGPGPGGSLALETGGHRGCHTLYGLFCELMD